LRLSRLNDLPGNLKASQPEDAILEAFNRSKVRSSERVSRLGRAVYPRWPSPISTRGSWPKLSSAPAKFASALSTLVADPSSYSPNREWYNRRAR